MVLFLDTSGKPAFLTAHVKDRMDKTYSPHAIEQSWYETWESRGYFAPSGQGESYCIMIPPPNVTGTLHMGHAFQDSSSRYLPSSIKAIG